MPSSSPAASTTWSHTNRTEGKAIVPVQRGSCPSYHIYLKISGSVSYLVPGTPPGVQRAISNPQSNWATFFTQISKEDKKKQENWATCFGLESLGISTALLFAVCGKNEHDTTTTELCDCHGRKCSGLCLHRFWQLRPT